MAILQCVFDSGCLRQSVYRRSSSTDILVLSLCSIGVFAVNASSLQLAALVLAKTAVFVAHRPRPHGNGMIQLPRRDDGHDWVYRSQQLCQLRPTLRCCMPPLAMCVLLMYSQRSNHDRPRWFVVNSSVIMLQCLLLLCNK